MFACSLILERFLLKEYCLKFLLDISDCRWHTVCVRLDIEQVYQLGPHALVTGVYAQDKLHVVIQDKHLEEVKQKIQDKGEDENELKLSSTSMTCENICFLAFMFPRLLVSGTHIYAG